jgi:hypothetical protein
MFHHTAPRIAPPADRRGKAHISLSHDKGDRSQPTRLFLLRIIRLMAVGGINDARATAMLLAQFGRNHRRALVLIRAMMLEIARISNRTILLAPPCCGRITRDEALLLSALGRDEAEFSACHGDACALLGHEDSPGYALGAATCFQAVSACFADMGAPFSG